MDSLLRDRLLRLQGIELRAAPPRDPDEELDDEPEDDLEEDEEDEDPVYARHRTLQLLGVELRARTNPAPGRQVITREGMKKYGLPMGATITPGMRRLTEAQQQAVENLSDADRDKYQAARKQGSTHTQAMAAAKGTPAKTPRKAAKKAAPNAKEKAKVDRQARIDKVRGTAESVAEALELLDNEASEKALRHRINAMHTAGKIDEKARDRMLAGVDDGNLGEVVHQIADENGLKLTAEPGDVVAWKKNSGLSAAAGHGFREGTQVRVFRPGVRYDPGDGEVLISGGLAEEATPEEIAEAKKKAGALGVFAIGAQQGRGVTNLPPVRVQVDASSGSDVGRWKAVEVTGPGGSQATLLAAVTRRVRDSGHLANSRLRHPDGTPLADWEIKMREGLTPEALQRLDEADAARKAKDDATADRDIKALDRAMEQSKLPSAAVLWRGIRPADINLPDGDATGFEWTDPGYVGTSATRDVPERSFAQGALLHILAPEGTPVLGIEGGGESEILLGRGQRFRVVGERRTASGGRELDVEIVSAAPSTPDAPNTPLADLPADQRAVYEAILRRANDGGTKKSEGNSPAGRARNRQIDDLVAEGYLQQDPKSREVEVENRIRDAYRRAPKLPAGWVKLHELRPLLADLPRDEVDAALARLNRERGNSAIPEENQKALTQADRDAAVNLGGRDFHEFLIENPSPRPVPDELFTLTDKGRQHIGDATPFADEAAAEKFDDPAESPRDELASKKVAELKDMLRARGLKVSGTKAELIARLRGAPAARNRQLQWELRDTPGGDEFEAYWTRGEGLARWLGRPHEWTTLRNLLRKHPGVRDPEGLASKYFHKVKGFHAGADLHRVEHGKPPRGDRIGPG